MMQASIANELLARYGVKYTSFTTEQREALMTKSDFVSMECALDFLVNDLHISVKSIEKCPSVLYLNVGYLKTNYKFLTVQGIGIDRIQNCLHILSTVPSKLQDTYFYVRDNYGEATFTKNLTILSTDVARIKELEKNFGDNLSKSTILSVASTTLRVPEINDILAYARENGIEITGGFFQKGVSEVGNIIDVCSSLGVSVCASMFRHSSEEVRSIISVCRSKGIEITGSVFLKNATEVSKIVEKCNEVGIPITGSVFRKSALEIDDIAKTCNELGIPISGTLFLRTAEEIRDIYNICRDNGVEMFASMFKKSPADIKNIIDLSRKYGIEIRPALFKKSAISLERSIKYVKENYGDKYLMPLVVAEDVKHLKNVFPYLANKNVLPAVLMSPAILTLKMEEIVEREAFIKSLGEDDVISGKFNPIYGLSKSRYADKKRKANRGISR